MHSLLTFLKISHNKLFCTFNANLFAPATLVVELWVALLGFQTSCFKIWTNNI